MLEDPEWKKVRITMVEQTEAKFRFQMASFKDDQDRNQWLMATETLMKQNIHQGFNSTIDRLFHQQDNVLGREYFDELRSDIEGAQKRRCASGRH